MNFNSDTRYQISVSITDDKQIQDLNKRYRDKDYPTDVLSFNIDKEVSTDEFYIGDIVVNKDQARRQASKFNNSLEEEIADLVRHGILHLLGIHHDGDDH